ncbi:MAG: helix-turn-helix domain-containing protein [Rikenellaceae bacterium]
MEIESVDARVWAQMMARMESLGRKMESLAERTADKGAKQWLDNQDVCVILNISKRTLQTYRDNGTIPYSQINHKMYYRPSDVENLINKRKK